MSGQSDPWRALPPDIERIARDRARWDAMRSLDKLLAVAAASRRFRAATEWDEALAADREHERAVAALGDAPRGAERSEGR